MIITDIINERKRHNVKQHINHLIKNIEDRNHISVLFSKYSEDMRFKISSDTSKYRKGGGNRAPIYQFSVSSIRRFKFYMRNSKKQWGIFVDLTYPKKYIHNGKIVKKHLNTFLQLLRRKNIKFFWVMEFQKRGAPHFHILCDKFIDKNYLRLSWYRIVGSKDPNHLKAGTRVGAIRSANFVSAYLVGYLKKLSQKKIPKNYQFSGRFWGISRDVLKQEHQILTFKSREEVQKFLTPYLSKYQEEIFIKTYERYGNPYLFDFNGYGFVGYETSEMFENLEDFLDAMFFNFSDDKRDDFSFQKNNA